MRKSLASILQNDEGARLETALLSKADSPVLLQLESPENTLKFMRAYLRGSYLFGRYIVPMYLSHIFAFLTSYSPADDKVGIKLRNIMEMCMGELSTNNIYNIPGQSHAHFHDLYTAYAEAGGDVEEFDNFMTAAQRNIIAAIGFSLDGGPTVGNSLWSKGAAEYAKQLLTVSRSSLASFILMPCNEMLTTVIYPVAVRHLCREPRFNKFRHFMEVHIYLDGDSEESHSSVALDWLELAIEKEGYSSAAIKDSTEAVLKLYEK